eukprot:PITA_23200
MASSGKIEIEKFNGQSFELWKLKMEDLLVDKDQWIAVDPGTKPTGVTDEEWKKLDRKAKSTIRLCVSDLVLLNVSGEATTKALWDKLGTLYQSKSLVNKLFLREKLYNLRMKDGDLVTEHLNAFNTVVSQLSSVDIKISDEDKCISLLCSLPDSWDSLVIAIGNNATALQFDEIVSALLTEEIRWKNMDNQNGDVLSEGRFRRDCNSKAPDKGKGSDDAPSVEAKTTSDEGGDVYLASSSTPVDHEAWLIDSGASFHFTPHSEWFCEYEKYDGGDVFLGDDRKARIIVRGKVKLKLQGGRVRTLPDVLHIPALARNLISVSKWDDAGVKTVFEKDTCKMVQGALVLMRRVRIGTLYKLQGSTVIDRCNSSMVPENGAENLVVSEEKTMMCHQRLGHTGEKGLRILHGKDDFSKNTWIYFLKKKSEVFDTFKEFKALVENQTEKKIKVLRIDNSGEFCNKEFEEFWAVETACYLVNRSPSSALEDKTPQDVWTGKEPSLSHLMVFGCDAYVHVPKKKRTKLDSKSEKCIFIGEVKDVIKHEVQPKEPEKIDLELKKEESDSTTKEESEDEEPQTPAVRRSVRERRQPKMYSPSSFCSNFALYVTDDDPRTVKEVVDSEDGKLWKEAMVNEMASLLKNEAWDLVELPAGRKPIAANGCSRRRQMQKGRWRNTKLGW